MKKDTRSPLRRFWSVLIALVLGLGGAVVATAPAHAVMPNFQMPFPCGEVWKASTYTTPAHPAIDWNAYPDDNGRSVVASAAGTATLYFESLGGYQVIIDHGNGWKTVYAHLQQAGRVSGPVTQGQLIGYVGGTGNNGNGFPPHLHWEQIHNGVQQNTLYANGSALSPGSTYTTSDPSYTSNNCVQGGTSRIGVVSANGTLFVKEGPVDAGWVIMQGNVAQYALTENRVGVLMNDGVFQVKEGTLSAGWTSMQGGVSRIAMSGDRIGIVTTNGDAYIKEGTIGAPWVLIEGSVADIALAGNRIAILTTTGVLKVKEGSIYNGWVTLQGSVTDVSVSPNRIGIILTNGDVQVKDGSIYSGWITIYGSSTNIELTDTRIAVLDSTGTFYLKDGSVYSGWITMQGAVSQISLGGNRIGIILTNGNADVKEGPVSAGWITVNGPMTSIKISS